ncbi:MAG TPA: ACP phosphodiesterase [Chitinophagaceae bacterium]|nr:ACP phosphodiesterase [Chitinophagaceae bacterium]
MNYLAHAYLSFGRPGILVGNMISDYVKGKKKYDYPEQIQQGIAVHREIDRFTDSHLATKAAKEVFRSAYRLYAGSLMDVIYDHFLALDENEFTDESLKAFTINTYAMLDQFTDHFPEKFSRMYPYMKAQNWLYNYRYRQGVEKSLAGVVRRAKYLEESDTAFQLFNEHYDRLKGLYQLFFPELKNMTMDFLKQFDR